MSEVSSNQPTGTPNWVDLGVPDIERAMQFYTAVFGWRYADQGPESGNYTMCLLRDYAVAGMMQNPDPSATEYWWNLYLATDDCDGTVKRVADAGGTVVMPPMDVMESGRMAILTDPSGAQFGLWQGRAHVGSELVNEPGTLSWNELHTPDSAAARAFYGTVFGYGLEPMTGVPDLDYTVLRVDGHEVGGLYGTSEVPTARWVTYFAVADADEAARKAVAAGGTVEGEPDDSPYGRIVSIRDPFGAEFRAIKLAENPSG
jgi:uncharacterized protein